MYFMCHSPREGYLATRNFLMYSLSPAHHKTGFIKYSPHYHHSRRQFCSSPSFQIIFLDNSITVTYRCPQQL
jgi:hypothetical protein